MSEQAHLIESEIGDMKNMFHRLLLPKLTTNFF